MQVPVFTHDDMTRHSGGLGHPERPERLRAVREFLETAPYASSLVFPPFEPVKRSEVERVHTARYVDRLERSASSEVTFFDTDTAANKWSYRAACLAAGAAVAAVDLVCSTAVNETLQRPFAIVRPPGHHAEPDRAMGFCFINSAAVAAAHAVAHNGLDRVAVVDWDVHHGNGTQRIFWDRADVFYASVHESPLYPGTGLERERGAGAGAGTTLNVPLSSGSGEAEYLRAFDEIVLPALDAFAPQLIVVSAGFDAHREDPLASMELDAGSYRKITDRLVSLASRHAQGRIVHLLEGGYHVTALTAGVDSVIRSLLEQTAQETE